MSIAFTKSQRFLGLLFLVFIFCVSAASAEIIVSSESDNVNPVPDEIVTVLINIDMSATQDILAEYSIEIRWDPSVIEYQSVSGGTTENFTSLESVETDVAIGKLLISWLDIDGSGGNVNVGKVEFKAVGSAGEKTFIDLIVASLSAANLDDLLPQHTVQSGLITILGPTNLISPTDMSYIPVDQSFTRTWEAVPNATLYQLEESTDQVFTSVINTQDLAATEYTSSYVTAYSVSSPVYWRVRAEVDGEYGDWSDVWRIYTDLGPLEVLAPTDMAYIETGEQFTYRWSPVENATEYQFVSHSNPDFSGVTPITLTGTSYSSNIESEYTSDSPYYWRVRAKVNGQYGEWSETWRIITKKDGILPPTNIQLIDVPGDHGHSLILTWTLSPDDDTITHYYIYRSRNSELSENILSVESFSTIVELIEAEENSTILIDNVPNGTNSYTDETVPLSGVLYYYWIQSVNESGGSEKIAAGFVTSVSVIPNIFKVKSPYPNPFNPTTTIQYEIPFDTHVKLVIYDILGRKIAVLQNGIISAGVHEAKWDGKNKYGELTGSGVYVYQLITGDHKAQGKVLFLR